jgi:SAM-dependent methyltransferase
MNQPAGAEDQPASSTAGVEYARRLQRLSGRRWKRLIDVQAPYRWNIHRLRLGRTLDVGCGIGRNLKHLGAYVKPGGVVCIITPQKAGYRSDTTHVRFVNFAGMNALSDELGLHVIKQYSFPLPRPVGAVFRYNEFVHVSRTPARAADDQSSQRDNWC